MIHAAKAFLFIAVVAAAISCGFALVIYATPVCTVLSPHGPGSPTSS
jgi:hypothetical protein